MSVYAERPTKWTVSSFQIKIVYAFLISSTET